jgi:hypothetical protein
VQAPSSQKTSGILVYIAHHSMKEHYQSKVVYMIQGSLVKLHDHCDRQKIVTPEFPYVVIITSKLCEIIAENLNFC